jgi:gliding motility-associated-like protein
VSTVTATKDTTVCASAVPFKWNGLDVTKADDYVFTTKSQAGCDSTITLRVAVVSTVTATKDTTVCTNQLPFTWNGISVTAAGNYPYLTKSAAGCDSTITLRVAVVNTVTATKDTTVCASAVPFTWNGISVTAAGNYPYQTKSAAGCDSTITLRVAVVSTVTATKDTTVCASAVPFKWNGLDVTKADDYVFTTKSQAGCDSTITLRVAVVSTVTATKDTTVCTNQLPFTWNGISVTAAGNYPYQTKSAAGCDSIITLRVKVNQPTASITTVTICQNQLPYTWNTVAYTTTGTFTYTTKNSVGCDSIATLKLTIVQTVKGPVDSITVCANALPYQWNGINITAPGTYTKTLTSFAGCDSIATLVVATQPIATATVSGGNPICPGQSTTISIGLTGNAPWTLTYNEGTTSHTISGILSTPYVLTVSPANTTTYTLRSVSDAKCSNNNLTSSVTIIVSQVALPGVRYAMVTAAKNVAKQLSARDMGTAAKYNWAPPAGLNFTDVRTPVFMYDKAVEYLITINPGNGCRVVDTLRVAIVESPLPIRSSLHVPNAWSPNNDGSNDKLYPLTINMKELYYFRVFNRWGQLMFETNKLDEGWDGMYKGKPQVQDVYTWTVEAEGLDGVHYKQSGNSILLR